MSGTCEDCGGEVDDFGPHLCDFEAFPVQTTPRVVPMGSGHAGGTGLYHGGPTSMRAKVAARLAKLPPRGPAERAISDLSRHARAAVFVVAAGARASPRVLRTLERAGVIAPGLRPAQLTTLGQAVESALKARNSVPSGVVQGAAGGV